VGGNVTGLSGALVLRDNGADDLGVTSNGGFAFKTSLQAAAVYAVTVAAQPANQTCSVASGTGTIGSANVTNVAVTCISAPPPGPSGTLDTSFGAGGKVTTDFSGAPPAAASARASSAKPNVFKTGGRS